MLTLEQKIELANWIVTHNEHMCLGGSLSLYIRCKQLGVKYPYKREPHDIDIQIDYNYYRSNRNVSFLLPPFITQASCIDIFNDNNQIISHAIYNNDLHLDFLCYKFYREEIIKDINNDSFISNNNCFHSFTKQYKLSLLFQMIGAKFTYLNGKSSNKEKHKNDILTLYNFINQSNYNWEKEYICILKDYIDIFKEDFCLGNKDFGRRAIENYIETYIVKDDPKLIEWFNYLKNIEHSDLIYKENKIELLEKIIRTRTLC